MFVLFVMQSYLIEVRGLKPEYTAPKPKVKKIVSYRGTWIETNPYSAMRFSTKSYLIEVRGLKHSIH